MNEQPIEKQSLRIGGMVELHHIFPTIQGEGPFAGSPAVFVRLAGCNLQCPWCDTEYTSQRELVSPEEIVHRVAASKPSPNMLVVVTGGEPFRQNIGPMCDALIRNGYSVQVETNGTLFAPNLSPEVTIVCSPKAGRINPRLAPMIDAYKYVLHADSIDPEDGLPIHVLGTKTGSRVARPPQGFRGDIFVQPIDVGDEKENKRHLHATIASAFKFGYILCLQLHKLIELE